MIYVIRPGWKCWTIRKRGTGKLVAKADNFIAALAKVKELNREK